MKFKKLKLKKNLLRGISKAGFSETMPVQEETFAYTLKGKDVFVQSQTGTGKTAAFLITIFQLLLEKYPKKTGKALIIVPTRELATQIETETKLIGKYLDFVIGSFYGGVGYTQQESLIKKGVNIIIGTPGRLIDFNQSGKLDFSDIDFLVIDEADRLLDMGFLPDIKKMLKKMTPCSKRHTMLFSATLNYRVRNLAWEFMNEPVEIKITPDQLTVDKISQDLYHVGKDEKMNLLLGILKKEITKNALIFTNTKHAAFEVAKRLECNGHMCDFIIGDLPQKKRHRKIEDLKSGKIQFLVATDVAARGLHIDSLKLVINYDLPEDCENYVHRIGRTARAGKSGQAISFACEKYVYNLEAIESFINMKINVEWADDVLFEKDKSYGRYFSFDERDFRKNHERSSIDKSSTMVGKKKYLKTGEKSKIVKRQKENTDSVKFNNNSDRKSRSTSKSLSNKKKNGSLEDRLEYYKIKYGDNYKSGSDSISK